MKDDALNSRRTKLLIICFHVDHSGSFHLMQPVFKDLKDDYKNEVNIVLIEKGADIELEEKYEILYFPSLLLIWKGQVAVRLYGLVNRKELYDHVDHLLKEVDEKTKELYGK